MGVSKVLWFGGFRGLQLDLFGALKVSVKNDFSTQRFHAYTVDHCGNGVELVDPTWYKSRERCFNNMICNHFAGDPHRHTVLVRTILAKTTCK